MINQTKETTRIKDPASPNHQEHPVHDASSKQQAKQKYKPSHQQTGLTPPSALSIRGKANKPKNNSAQISLYKLTQTTGPSLGWKKPKGRKNSILKLGKRRPQTQWAKKRKKEEKAEKYYTMKEKTRNTEVQINAEEIGKLPEKEFRIISKDDQKRWKQDGESKRIK